MQQITIGSRTYNLVTAPSSLSLASIEITMSDSVATVVSPFTRQTQTQTWPGGDWWALTCTTPPLTREDAWQWEAFLASCQGQLNVFQVGDPRAVLPLGGVAGSAPVVSGANTAMTNQLSTSGWRPNGYRLLLPGDYLQIDYRMYRVMQQVNSDSSGNATLNIWPSLREVPANGTALVLKSPQGLFRLASNSRKIQTSPEQLTTISFQAVEVR